MTVLVAAVVLLAIALAVVAALLVAVLRRLQEHEVRMAGLVMSSPSVIAGAGHPVGELPVPAPALVGFFSPSCDSCEERLPEFREAALGHDGGVLAVVIDDSGGESSGRGSLAPRLADVAEVVVEGAGGPLATRFAVTGYPAFALVDDDGRVRWGGFEPVAART